MYMKIERIGLVSRERLSQDSSNGKRGKPNGVNLMEIGNAYIIGESSCVRSLLR